MKPYGSKWATIKYPGSTKPHGRWCGVCYPSEKISVNKTRARQEEWQEIQKYQEEMMEEDMIEDIRRDAYQVISDRLEEVKAILKECESLARETGLTFYLDMGQSNYFDGELGMWQSSSSNC